MSIEQQLCTCITLFCSGGSRGEARGARPPLFLDHTEARSAEKIFLFKRWCEWDFS